MRMDLDESDGQEADEQTEGKAKEGDESTPPPDARVSPEPAPESKGGPALDEVP